ncbi:hypothetical protein ACIA6T_12000 [Streptomyces sp. NPDC051740]|uniref:hypothetical protein n=1 Tax=Streptomyces sp. NPDC051740 TaxID=3365673 RepID=UPI003798A253
MLAEHFGGGKPFTADTPPVRPAGVTTGTSPGVNSAPPTRPDTEQAHRVVEACWADRVSVRETTHCATRSPAFVNRQLTKLYEDRGPAPIPGRLARVGEE